MRALFGCGSRTLFAGLRLQQWEGPDLTGQDLRDVMRLGAPLKIIDDATPFRVEVGEADRCAQRDDRGAGGRLSSFLCKRLLILCWGPGSSALNGVPVLAAVKPGR